ncbi:MAG: glycoside hydrolase family 95 protein [Muribaculaceae bacterium]|nr:glycoside hydrolase family 95 protein [Muribaculaceae bacterium]
MKIPVSKSGLVMAAAMLVWASGASASSRLWYDTPADDWMKAVPLGNGRIGAMVYGGDKCERIALNEISLWSGCHDATSNDLCGREALDEMRGHFFSGNIDKGNELGEKYLTGRMTSFGTHVPLGDMTIEVENPSEGIKDYVRALSLDDATATVSYRSGTTTFTREYIADYPDDVLAMRFTADSRKAMTATIGFELLQDAQVKASGDDLTLRGKVSFPLHGPGGVNFYGKLRVIPNGGMVEDNGDRLRVVGADSFDVIFDLRTDYAGDNYAALCDVTVDKAAAKGYAVMRKSHVADYRRLYDRMTINLGGPSGDAIPTDKRLKAISEGKSDPGFDALFFQYGRYMLISSSRKTAMPLCANLQGIWNDNRACNMPWTCDYHLDENIQQNYWSANRANLAECNEPLFAYLGLLADHGRDTAMKMYGSRGWVAHTVCNAWGYTAPGWGVSWGMNVTGGAWLATHLWSHYRYTADKRYLRDTAYPILRGAALFFSDYMSEDPSTGHLMTGPSISPENGYSHDGKHYSLSMMPTIDRVMVYDLYDACIRSADILGIDDEFTARLRRDIKRLPPLEVGRDGLLKEWPGDVRRSDPSHRHSSHVLSLFPLDHVSVERQPELARACRKSLESQTSDPAWEDTEWSTANMLCFYARLKDADAAHGWLQNLFRRFMRENLMTVSPAGVAMAEEDIFSFDATEGGVAGICEMLLQCHEGYLDILPALPAQWRTGSVKGLCAYDGLEVDIAWKNGKATSAVVKATGKDCSVKVKGFDEPFVIAKGESVNLKF